MMIKCQKCGKETGPAFGLCQECLQESDERFSVYQFFPDGQYEQVRSHVPVQEAMKAAQHYCTSVGARIGTTVRVIITDSGDEINFEWKFGEGVVYGLSGQQPPTGGS